MREREITHLRDALGITDLEKRVKKLEPKTGEGHKSEFQKSVDKKKEGDK